MSRTVTRLEIERQTPLIERIPGAWRIWVIYKPLRDHERAPTEGTCLVLAPNGAITREDHDAAGCVSHTVNITPATSHT